MKQREAPSRIRENISIQQVGTETLVYDQRRHQAFCLNQSSSIIWQLANGERSIAEISTAASAQLGTCITDDFVTFALETLRKNGLLESAPSAAATPVLSRRTMLQRLGVGGLVLLPIVSAIVAPTAAQAYSGCVDCSVVAPARRVKKRTTTSPSQ